MEDNTIGRKNAFRVSWKRTLLDIAVLMLSGGCMTLAFAPVNCSFFAWICIMPLLWLCAGRSKKRAFLYGLIWGWMWHFTNTFFFREIFIGIPFIFAVVLALFNAFFAILIPPVFSNLLYPEEIRKADFMARRNFYEFPAWAEITATVTLASAWTVIEWVRSWIFTGFPWNLLGVSQWQNTSLIQICEYTGIYGLSFLIALFNIACYFAIRGFRYSLPENKYKRPFPLIIAIVAIIVAGSIGVRLYNHTQHRYRKDCREFGIGVVQPYLSLRRAGTGTQSMEALEVCSQLSEALIVKDQENRAVREARGLDTNREDDLKNINALEARKAMLNLDLIVWPESAVPRYYYEMFNYESIVDAAKKNGTWEQLKNIPKPFGAIYRENVRSLLARSRVPILLGTITFDLEEIEADEKKSYQVSHTYNSALLLKHAEKTDPEKYDYDTAGKYSKVHLVPFGEFVPLAKYFPSLDNIFGMGRSLTEGKKFHAVNVKPDLNVGCLICYEDVFAYAARGQAQDNANMLLVITNDAWYPESSEPEQHYINSIFRTIETRLPMVRCGNSNYSVLISPCGELEDAVCKRYDSDGNTIFQPEYKKSASDMFLVRVKEKPEKTFYTRFGDVFVLFCGFLLAIGMCLTVFKAFLFAKLLGSPFTAEQDRIRAEFLAAEKKHRKSDERISAGKDSSHNP